MCAVGLRKESSNLFPRERERQNTKSATFRSYTEESKTTFKAKSNVQNKRHYQVAEKQPWLIDLLVKLKPSYFAPCQGIEECKLALHNLGEDIKQQELSWKRGKFLLSYIRDITEKDDEIIISYKGGKPCVYFKIEESKAKES